MHLLGGLVGIVSFGGCFFSFYSVLFLFDCSSVCSVCLPVWLISSWICPFFAYMYFSVRFS